MSEIVKTGSKPSAANTKKPARNVTPKLVCIVTGHDRFTNKEYLAQKAATVGSMKKFLEHYVCSDAMVLLREGKSVEEVRKQLKVEDSVPKPSVEAMKIAMEINGKRAKKAKAPKAAKEGKTAGTSKPKAAAKPATPKAAPAPASGESTPAPASSSTAS